MLFRSGVVLLWAGVITAILYSLFVALNIGIEFFGFCLLLLSAILIGIWATWCLPCRVEMPSLDNLQSEMGDENFQVVIVSVERTPFSKVDDFLREIDIKNLKNYHDPTTMVGKHINAKYNIGSLDLFTCSW